MESVLEESKGKAGPNCCRRLHCGLWHCFLVWFHPQCVLDTPGLVKSNRVEQGWGEEVIWKWCYVTNCALNPKSILKFSVHYTVLYVSGEIHCFHYQMWSSVKVKVPFTSFEVASVPVGRLEASVVLHKCLVCSRARLECTAVILSWGESLHLILHFFDSRNASYPKMIFFSSGMNL